MEDNYRNTEFSFSNLIHNLYGDKDYRLIHTSHNFVDAKKYFLKIMTSIRFATEETIVIVDNHHKQELTNTIARFEEFIKSSTSFEALDQIMISFQSEMIFMLIGQMPHRWHQEKVINTRNAWKLDDSRQIQYLQTIEQKKNIIFSAVQNKYKETFGSWTDFLGNIYYRECHNDPSELIEWVREKYPDIYSELF